MTAAASPLALRDRLEKDLARGTSDLPTLPRSATEALRLARMPSVDFDDLARVAGADPPLAARVVSVANSAAYARGGMPKIASVRQAAVRIGIQATRDVLYQVAYASIFVDTPRFRERVEATFQHGAATARATRIFAADCGLDLDIAFLSGLLHDLGRARCWKLLARCRDAVDDVAVAVEAVDALHATAGAELAAAWHLPDEVVDVCRWHHEPSGRPYPLLVAAADAISPLDPENEDAARAHAWLVEAGIPEGQADSLVEEARTDAKQQGAPPAGQGTK